MKLLISKLDNGYTLTATHPDGRKERFAFESYPPLATKVDLFLIGENILPEFLPAAPAEQGHPDEGDREAQRQF